MSLQFTEYELQTIYKNHVKKTNEYFQKYQHLPPCPVNKYNNNWQNFDFPRNWCILDFKEWINQHNISNIEHLGYTCNTDPELEFLTYNNSTLVEYPQFDLHTFSQSFTNVFDFFIFSQTLEHLYNPFKAVENIYKSLKPGGYVFTSVPTINIPHMTPIHFNGFTPMGLAMLFKSANFEIIEIGQWGNYEYIQRLFGKHTWPGYNDLNKNGYVSNEERNVCQCWILARKM
jgi:SAM-dependent methyltransferase